MAGQPGSASSAGRRPRDRRQRIIERAAALFAERGFQAVTTQDIADSEGITAGALYRHFESKADLLFAIFDEYFRRGAPTDNTFDSLETMIAGRVASTSTAPFLGSLWAQESHQLAPARHAELSRQLRLEFARWADLVSRERPSLPRDHADLIGMTLTAVLTAATQSFRGLRNGEKLAMVTAACHGVAAVDWSGPSAPHTVASGGLPTTPAERILSVAVEQFGREGYDDASLAAIGRGAGITAASIYSHYDSKSALWDRVLERTRHRLWLDLGSALASSGEPREQLTAVVGSYVRVLRASPRLVASMIGDPACETYLQEWSYLVRALDDVPSSRAAATVTTAVTVMNSLASTPEVLAREDFCAAATAVGCAVLVPHLG